MMNEIITVEDIFNELSKATKLYGKRYVDRDGKTVDEKIDGETTTKYWLTDAGENFLNICDTVNKMNSYDRFECDSEFIEGQGNTMSKYKALKVIKRLIMPAAVLMDTTLSSDRRAMDYLIRRIGNHVIIKLGEQEFVGRTLRPDEFVEAQRDLLHAINRKVVQAPVEEISRPVIVLSKDVVRTTVTRKSDVHYVVEDMDASSIPLWVIKNPGWYEDRAYTQMDDEFKRDIVVSIVKGFKDAATSREALVASSGSSKEEVHGNDGPESK